MFFKKKQEKSKTNQEQVSTQKSAKNKTTPLKKVGELTSIVFDAVTGISEQIQKVAKMNPRKLNQVWEETNIIGVIGDYLVTQENSLVKALRVEGISYVDLDENIIDGLANAREMAYKSVDDGLTLKILIKRRKLDYKGNYKKVKGVHPLAQTIIDKWETEQIFKNDYYLIFEVENTSVVSGLFSKKKTQNIQELEKLSKQLEGAVSSFEKHLHQYSPKKITPSELLSVYAEYVNGVDIKFKLPNDGILTDSYLGATLEFNSDFFIQNYGGGGRRRYGRILSVKNYETESISSLTISKVINSPIEVDVIVTVCGMGRIRAIRELTNKRRFVKNIYIREDITDSMRLIEENRISLLKASVAFLPKGENLDELNQNTDLVMGEIEANNWTCAKETINLIPAYFSLFPHKNTFNPRLKLLFTHNLASLCLFEGDNGGFIKNSWGEYPLTVFRNQSRADFLFNFHSYESEWKHGSLGGEKVKGHTLLIGTTGGGKTTLMSFLLMNCLKYNIDIIALDRLSGLYPFTQFFDGDYSGYGEESFKINPLSLRLYDNQGKPIGINFQFLESWLLYACNIDPTKAESARQIQAVQQALQKLKSMYLQGKQNEINLASFKDAVAGLDPSVTEDLNLGFAIDNLMRKDAFYQKGNYKDSLEFTKRITTINMDSLVSENAEDTGTDLSLMALYIFHKILTRALLNNRGFFLFIDEFASYTKNKTFANNVKTLLTQARKANGVVCFALQDINQLQELTLHSPQLEDSYMKNIANLILYPQNNFSFDLLEGKYGIRFSEAEKKFLRETSPRERKVLIKNIDQNRSVIVDVNLAKLDEYLNIFATNTQASSVIQELKKDYPNRWKELYLDNFRS